MWATETLADYICGLRPEDLTSDAVAMAKRCILDLLGAAAAGFETDAAAAVRDAGSRTSAGGRSLWFTDLRFSGPFAALMNSAAASALDLDDGHRAAGGHPGASIIPAAVAIAEEVEAGPEEFLAAIVAGYEVGIRVAAARDFTSLDTLSTGRWCSYGAAAAGGLPAENGAAEAGSGPCHCRSPGAGVVGGRLQLGDGKPCKGRHPLVHFYRALGSRVCRTRFDRPHRYPRSPVLL